MPTRFTVNFVFAWLMLMVVAGAATFGVQSEAAKDPRRIGGPFVMSDPSGKTVTDADLRGKPTAMFFGFTGCPQVCPTTLQMLTDVLGHMGPEADRLNVAFVTVDPGRDTPEQMRSYLTSFDPHIRGLIGTEAQLAAMAAAYHAQYRRVPLEGGDYTMEHTAAVLLLDGQGRFAGTLPDGGNAAQARLETLIQTNPCRPGVAQQGRGSSCNPT